jgi:hypothetical protein
VIGNSDSVATTRKDSGQCWEMLVMMLNARGRNGAR